MASWPPTGPTRRGRCSPARWRKSARRRSTCRRPTRTSSSVDARTLLFVGLGIALVGYASTIFRGGLAMPTLLQTAIGFVTAFFDTLGIGSFATTTAVYKLRRMVPVKLIPGTLNVGHTLSTLPPAFIYTSIVPVDPTTLVLMIIAGCIGSWLGAGIVGPSA